MPRKRSTRHTKRSQPKGVDSSGVLPLFAIPIALLAGYHFFVAPLSVANANEPVAGAAKSIVVVDSKAVLGAFMKKKQEEIAGGESYSEGEITASGAEFAAEYLRAVKRYRDQGFLVIDKQYALSVPVGSEITEEIGTALELDVVATPDPFSAPQLD